MGHGVSYSILSEIHTENTYFIQKQQPDKVILPINTPKEEFTIYLADLVYIVTSGWVKTPKSLLLPSVIKTLTNNTEL